MYYTLTKKCIRDGAADAKDSDGIAEARRLDAQTKSSTNSI